MAWLLGLREAFVIGIAPYVPPIHAELRRGPQPGAPDGAAPASGL